MRPRRDESAMQARPGSGTRWTRGGQDGIRDGGHGCDRGFMGGVHSGDIERDPLVLQVAPRGRPKDLVIVEAEPSLVPDRFWLEDLSENLCHGSPVLAVGRHPTTVSSRPRVSSSPAEPGRSPPNDRGWQVEPRAAAARPISTRTGVRSYPLRLHHLPAGSLIPIATWVGSRPNDSALIRGTTSWRRGIRCNRTAQPSNSRIGLPSLSLIGRPVAGAMFSLAGLRPRAVRTVACTSSMVVGRTGSLSALGIGLADRQAAADAAAGQGQAEAVRPVVAAAQRVDLRRPAELAAAQDDRPLEQLPPRQVAQQRGERRVEHLGARLVDLVVVDVRVPAAERDLDAAHADLDEPARGQAAAAEGRVAVLGERRAAGSCETSNALSCSEVIITRARASVSRCSVASTRPRRPRAKARSTTSRSWTRASSRGVGHAARSRRAACPCGSPIWKASNSPPRKPPRLGHLLGQDRDVPGDVGPAHRQLVAADRADRGMLDRRVGPVAGLHQVRAALVVALLAHHRPDQRDRPHLLGQVLEALGELDALDGGRDGLRAAGDPGVGVRVEGLELARAAVQPEQDDRLRRLPRSARPGRPAAARRASASSARPA